MDYVGLFPARVPFQLLLLPYQCLHLPDSYLRLCHDAHKCRPYSGSSSL